MRVRNLFVIYNGVKHAEPGLMGYKCFSHLKHNCGSSVVMESANLISAVERVTNPMMHKLHCAQELFAMVRKRGAYKR